MSVAILDAVFNNERIGRFIRICIVRIIHIFYDYRFFVAERSGYFFVNVTGGKHTYLSHRDDSGVGSGGVIERVE